MRFKVLAGQHVQKDPEAPPVKKVHPVTGAEYEEQPSKPYNRGEVVESEIDLEKRFGSEKFRRLGRAKKESATAVADPDEEDDDDEEEGDGLEQLTVNQLRKIAEEEEIDAADARNKMELVGRIRVARVSRESEGK